MNETIAEFLLRQVSDAAQLARRAEVLAAMTQLPPQRRNELAQAVNLVCQTIAQRGGRARVRFSLVQHSGHQFIEISVSDQQEDSPSCRDTSARTTAGNDDGNQRPETSQGEEDVDHDGARPGSSGSDGDCCESAAVVIQRVGELVDHFETSGWPVSGAVIRMAQALSPSFAVPSRDEVTDWAHVIRANNPLDALAYACRRAHDLEVRLGHARHQHDIRSELARSASQAENLTLLSLVFSKTKNAIAMLDPSGTIVWVNEAFIQMTGYGDFEAKGARLDDLLFGPSTAKETVRAYRNALHDGVELTQDVLRYRRDGQTFWVESNLIPVKDRSGEVTRWITIDTDITKRWQTEQALRAAKESAEASSRAKSEFLANLSHEIRTPMNAIIGMTDLSLDTELSDEQREFLQTVQREAGSLLRLLDDILDLSRIEAGKLQTEEIDFPLTDLVQETLKAFSVEAQRKKLRLTAIIPPDIPSDIRGDPTRLRQILMNLIGNAIKFTDEGEVAIEIAEQWRNESEIGLHFQVRDTGSGIERTKLDKIFEAFTQSDASTSRKYGGSGLGLTITSRLVSLMNGRIWVHSEEGIGSTFHVTLTFKLSDSTDKRVEGRDRPPSSAGLGTAGHLSSGHSSDVNDRPSRSLRVLIADDHDANRHLARTVLTRRGHQCSEAADGREALDMLASQTIDVVLLDVQMPEIDGFEVTRVVRAREQKTGRHVPIVALTAHAMAGDREKCLAAGMDAYLAKPLRPARLIDMVERFGPVDTDRSPESGTVADVPGVSGFSFESALESLDSDVDLLVDQMGFFLHDGPQLVEQIRSAITAGDTRQLELAAHRLKSMLARYAFHDAAGVAYDLEQRGHQNQLDAVMPLVDRLEPMVNQLAEGIRAYIARHRATRD